MILGLMADAVEIEWVFAIVLLLLAGPLGTVIGAERRNGRVA